MTDDLEWHPTYAVEWKRSVLKSGKPGNRWYSVPILCTVLNVCSLCGVRSTPKKVQIRNDVYGWNCSGPNDYETKSKSMLCMGCWNKIRPLKKRQRDSEELRSFINRLQRTLRNERKQKDQDDRRAS